MKKIIIIFTLFFSYVTNIYAQKNVAVYVTGDQENAIKKVLGSRMVTFITESNDFTAIERTADFLSALNSEHDYQVSGEVTNSQIVKLGQQFGALYVAVVDVTELYGELFVSSRLINVQTAQVSSSYEATGQGGSLSALSKLADSVADGLILAPERKRLEAIKQAAAQEQALLRQKAKKNLLPVDAVEYGNYIVINRKVPIEITYDNVKNVLGWKVSGTIPQGFKVADAGVIQFLARNYKISFEKTFDYSYYALPNCNVIREYIDRGKKHEIIKFYIPICSHLAWNRDKRWIGSLHKTKQGWDVTLSQDNYCVVLYREQLTEAEIQAEINRISR